jgi:hypothetical protein
MRGASSWLPLALASLTCLQGDLAGYGLSESP